MIENYQMIVLMDILNICLTKFFLHYSYWVYVCLIRVLIDQITWSVLNEHHIPHDKIVVKVEAFIPSWRKERFCK